MFKRANINIDIYHVPGVHGFLRNGLCIFPIIHKIKIHVTVLAKGCLSF